MTPPADEPGKAPTPGRGRAATPAGVVVVAVVATVALVTALVLWAREPVVVHRGITMCAGPPSPGDPDGCDEISDAPPELEPIITAAPGDADRAYPTAELRGVLELRSGFLVLDDAVVLWPTGTILDEVAPSVRMSDGAYLRVGLPVELSGGVVAASVAEDYGAGEAVARALRATGFDEVALVAPG